MKPSDYGFPYLGKLKHKKSTEIASSRLGVGFETLDRDMWDVEPAWGVLNELGVKWARIQSGWAKTEKVKGVYDFAWLDVIVDKLIERGVQPWMSVSYGNSLYTEGAPPDGVGYVPIYTDLERQAWVAYVKALVKHYRGRVTHYEIWNEPDSHFFKPKKDPALYCELVKLTAPAIKAECPEAYIIGGALACAMNPAGLEYSEAFYELGMADYVDAISYHGYKFLPEQYVDQEYPAFLHLMKRYKSSLDYWQGETGCPSKVTPKNKNPMANMPTSEAIQARWILRRILLELGFDARVVSCFTMADFSKYLFDGDLGFTSSYGITRLEDGKPKEAYYALQALATLLHDPLEVANGRTSFRMQMGDDDNTVSREQAAAAYQVNLIRGDVPVQAWWLREMAYNDCEWKSITMYYWMDQALRLDDPVLIDLASQDVYQLEKKRNWGMNEFANLPISISPMMLTDRSILELQ